jgi:lipopolysaccharide transport system ATP-binding protein
VGTGFHPELTGHENIYLYGAILGMDRWEVTRKFDEIVAFAELEKFVETPVKRYSSGMYMRLAFAVAAYMETEILLVDEVLAVGDAAFQKKCMGKMGDISKEGRTVLFVSHNMPAVRNLCDWTIWLRDGSVKLADRSTDAVNAYLGENLKAESLKDVDDLIASLPRDEIFRLDAVEIRQGGQRKELFGNGEPIEVEIRYEVLQRSRGFRVYFDILDEEGNILVRTYHDDDADTEKGLTPGHYRSIGVIPPNLLAPTSYIIRVCATVESSFNDYHCCVPGGVSIPIQLQWTSPTNRSRPGARIVSKIQPVIKWQTETLR